jgi:hypothetical protein
MRTHDAVGSEPGPRWPRITIDAMQRDLSDTALIVVDVQRGFAAAYPRQSAARRELRCGGASPTWPIVV